MAKTIVGGLRKRHRRYVERMRFGMLSRYQAAMLLDVDQRLANLDPAWRPQFHSVDGILKSQYNFVESEGNHDEESTGSKET